MFQFCDFPQGQGGAVCELRVKVQPDRSVVLESVKHAMEHITIRQNGRPGDARGSTMGPQTEFVCYCKVSRPAPWLSNPDIPCGRARISERGTFI